MSRQAKKQDAKDDTASGPERLSPGQEAYLKRFEDALMFLAHKTATRPSRAMMLMFLSNDPQADATADTLESWAASNAANEQWMGITLVEAAMILTDEAITVDPEDNGDHTIFRSSDNTPRRKPFHYPLDLSQFVVPAETEGDAAPEGGNKNGPLIPLKVVERITSALVLDRQAARRAEIAIRTMATEMHSHS